MARLLHERLSLVLGELPQLVTCSMGALIVEPDMNCDCVMLMNEADRMMYAAKRSEKGSLRMAVRGRG
jgi:GGDEF domain-containing protein